jgi:ribosomal protein S18 acetylase RimI-like enzyme
MNGGFEILPLAPERVEEVAELFHRVWHETQAHLQDPRIARHRDLAFFRNRVAERAGRTIIALENGSCAGFSVWTGGHLNSLFVAPELRCRGIGALLCAEVERQMARTGASQFDLDCIEGNWLARRFYERQGWRVEALVTMENETAEGAFGVGVWKMVKP